MKQIGTKGRKPLNIPEERVSGKLAECDFFLSQMKDATNVQEFGYYLSAFLSALKTFTDLGLMRTHGKGASEALLQLRKKSRDLDSLLSSRDVEVHREGVRIWRYKPSRGPQIVPRFKGSLWGDLLLTSRDSGAKDASSFASKYGNRFASRFGSRFRSRFGEGTRVALKLTYPAPANDATCSFILEDSGADVLGSCRLALDAVRSRVTDKPEAKS